MTSVTRSQPQGFRTDINGLRAWAVMAVVLFHFAVPGFSGGFVGVDVFFVISGFLMAGIIIGGQEAQRFSLPAFYAARARRIVPALLVVIVAVLLIGWFILMPVDYQQLGRHARESVFFTSNLRYLSEAGYFDSASHQKWLLHTWSLSVEWQFYLFYPLVLMALRRWLPGRSVLLWVHGIGLLASLALSQWWVAEEANRAFYLLTSRAWELLLGGSVFLLGERLKGSDQQRRALELLGFALILLALFGLDASRPWPGLLALLPTLGAALILLAARQQSLWSGSAVAQWLGTRSYSIYLWHWPLMVWLTYFGYEREPLWVGTAIALSLLLGHLSYHLIEQPASRWLGRRSLWRGVAWLLLAMVVIAVAAQWVRRSGIPERLPEPVARVEAERHNKNPHQKACLGNPQGCVLGGPEVTALVVGDSHADSSVMAVVDALADPARQGVYFRAESACLLIPQARRNGKGLQEDCEALRADLFNDFDGRYPGAPLILINRLTAYALGDLFESRDGKPQAPMVYFSEKTQVPTEAFLAEFRQHYLDSICQLTQRRTVYVLLPVPDMPIDVPRAMGRALMRGLPIEASTTLAQYQARNAFARSIMKEAAERCGLILLDPVPLLCPDGRCMGEQDGMPLYVDDDHLSMRGNRRLIPLFQSLFTRAPAAAQPE